MWDEIVGTQSCQEKRGSQNMSVLKKEKQEGVWGGSQRKQAHLTTIFIFLFFLPVSGQVQIGWTNLPLQHKNQGQLMSCSASARVAMSRRLIQIRATSLPHQQGDSSLLCLLALIFTSMNSPVCFFLPFSPLLKFPNRKRKPLFFKYSHRFWANRTKVVSCS